jgi:hypothetical protein
MPTRALGDVIATFEALGALLVDVDDCEGLICSLEGGLQGAIHMIDAELQRRPAAL